MRWLALALGLLLSAAGPEALADERRYALVIGANRGDSDEEPLLYAERDAERFARVLVDMAGVMEEDLVLIRGGEAGRVERALAEIARRVEAEARSGERQLLFVYYSGHAGVDGLHLRGSVLPHRALSAAVEAVPASMRVMVVDACRSGELTRVKGGKPVEPFAFEVQDRMESEGMAIITSSSVGEDAQESDRLRGGVFTHHLISGLQGAADESGDGRVTLTEAYAYSYRQTLDATSRAPVVQHPSYAFDLRGRDDLIITALDRVDRRGWIALSEAGIYMVFDARGDLVAEFDVPVDARLAVEPGDYTLRKREVDQVWQGEVQVIEGEVASLGGLDLVPYGSTVRKGYTERRSAVAVSLGGGLSGPLLDGFSPGRYGALGVRVDREALTLLPRLRYGVTGSENPDLVLSQRALGADLAAVKTLDWGRAAVGLGLRGGADGVRQDFETRGEAAPRQALVARTGPLLRLEYAPSGRWLLGLEASADIYLLRGEGTLQTPVVPNVYLDIARF